MINLIADSLDSMWDAVNLFLNHEKLTFGAVMTALIPFFVLWSKFTREKEKKADRQRLERNQRKIMEHWGIEGEWSVPISKPYRLDFRTSLLKSFTSLQMAQFIARFTKLHTTLRRKNNMSRKLILMLFGAIVLTLSQFGITLDPDTIIGIGTLIVSAILGQSAVDTNGLGQYAPLKEKFKSKKLWTALGGSLFIVLNDYFKLGISADIIYWVVGIGVTYILGKSAVSVVQASKNAGGQPNVDYNASSETSE